MVQLILYILHVWFGSIYSLAYLYIGLSGCFLKYMCPPMRLLLLHVLWSRHDFSIHTAFPFLEYYLIIIVLYVALLQYWIFTSLHWCTLFLLLYLQTWFLSNLPSDVIGTSFNYQCDFNFLDYMKSTSLIDWIILESIFSNS